MTATVLFCDLCNESVPQPDLDEGRATLVGGRVVCATCERLMSAGRSGAPSGAEGRPPSSGAAPSPAAASGEERHRSGGEGAPRSRRRRPGAGPAALGGIAVLLALGIGALLSRRIESMQVRYDDSLRRTVRDYRAAAAKVRSDARERDAEFGAVVASVRADLDRFGQELGDAERRWSQNSEEVMAELRDFDAELEGIKELTGLIERHDREMVGLQAKFAGLVDDLTRQGERLQALEERPAVAAVPAAGVPGASPNASPGGSSGAGGEGVDQPAWGHLLAGLASPNADERWMAVDELGQTGDPDVAAYLVPMLADEDTFVRMATARILGELEAPAGIPALIDALEDAEPAVREAAMVALQSVTGRDFKFDPHGTPAERAKRVKAWRQWWQKARDDYGA